MLMNATYVPFEGRTIHYFYFCNAAPTYGKNPYPENPKSKALWIKDSISAQQ
jgi:hypothetical protein